MIMATRDYINNSNINETNSLIDLLQVIDPSADEEVNVLEHSLYYNDTQFCNIIERTTGTLRILNLNIGGMKSRFENFKIFMEAFNNNNLPISVITLQETHITPLTNVSMFELNDYNFVYDLARINDFGGVAMYVHKSLVYNRLPSNIYKADSAVFESILIELYNPSHKQNKYAIGSIYRRPSEIVDEFHVFYNDTVQLIDALNNNYKNVYFNGDFNVDLLRIQTHVYYNYFYVYMTCHGFFPKITRPTRLSDNTSTLIDNIFSNSSNKSHVSGILTNPVSDHLMTFCILKGNETHTIKRTKYVDVESVSDKAIENFQNAIKKSNIITKLNLSEHADPNLNYIILSEILNTAKVNHIPKKRKKFNKRKHHRNPWMTNNLLVQINRKNDMYREWKSTSNIQEFANKKVNFKTYEKIVENNIIRAKHKYYHDTFLSQKNDIKKTWSTINGALNRNKYKSEYPIEFIVNGSGTSDPKDIANHFNTFFVNVTNNMDFGRGEHDFNEYLSDVIHTKFKFNSVNENDIRSVITRLKTKTSYGKDEISNKLLKAISNCLVTPLTIIINQTINTGIFPDLLKIAKVKPVFKKGDNKELNNYRPISLLPSISKIFERIMYTQIYTYFTMNNIMTQQQYGFRSNHSTELATVQFVDNILSNMDANKTPCAVYCDLSKAFDCLDYNILIAKLKYYGFSLSALSLVKNYLTNRKQYVLYENKESELLDVVKGIPQGSIVGPLYFSIYINDIAKSCSRFSFLLYADDTTISFNLDNFSNTHLIEDINSELEKVNMWLKCNKLKLNVGKTKSMLFTKRRSLDPLNLIIDNTHIEQVSVFKFLGIIIDENLSWKHHITMLCNKFSKTIGIFYGLRKIFPSYILLTLYKSLFETHIYYGTLVWGTKISLLETLQKKAIRTITNSHYLSHTEPLFKGMNLLKVVDIFSLRLLKFLHKLSNDRLPPYFNEYRAHLEHKDIPYSLRVNRLPVPMVRHVYAESCLIYQLVQIKNKMALTDCLIIDKIDTNSHSFQGFSKYVINNFIGKYRYECNIENCYTCFMITT